MRQRLLIGLLGVALLAAALFPFSKSDARRSTGQDGGAPTRPAPAKPAGLPNYDIRLAGRGEFTDHDLNPAAGRRRAAPNAATPGAARRCDEFPRAASAPKPRRNLRAVVNEAGAMKNFFIDGAPLSEPQSDTPDTHRPQFPEASTPSCSLCSDAGVANLKLHQRRQRRGNHLPRLRSDDRRDQGI